MSITERPDLLVDAPPCCPAESGAIRTCAKGTTDAAQISQIVVVLDATIVNIALPSAQSALGFSTVDRQWVVTAYALAFGSPRLLGGRLGDLIGRKITFLAGALGFAAASAVRGAATSFGMLVAPRSTPASNTAEAARPPGLEVLYPHPGSGSAGSPGRPSESCHASL